MSPGTPSERGGVAYTVSGLREPAEVLVDSWGVSHIYTSSIYDAFFVQGFNAARDRLWQMDLWRRRGLGLLSEVFGPAFVEKDRAARLFLYRGDMHGEWLAYGSDTKRTVTAFVAGINEYVRLAEEDSVLLPEEFRAMDYRPVRWLPDDVARIRSHGLYKNLESEVQRARTLHEFGAGVEALRSRLEPEREIVTPDGLDLSLIPDDVLRVYALATTPVEFGGVSPGAPVSAEGSNNWAVSPARTATGRPLLANDPHRTQSVPSLRYIVHLSAPGMDVIGAGEPALPGVSIGHNGRIAFGLTIFSIDQEDLYVYETNPENPAEYRYKDRWEPMETELQRIPVKDQESVEVELKFTRHGPVIHEDSERHTAFAVRAAWLEAGMAPYLGSMGYMRAENWDEFLAAMNRWGAPGENQVYADTSGNIGWKPGGLVPKRPNRDGLLPVPGDGRYEWDGFLDMDELPVELNPHRGWVASANEMNLPEGYPHEEKKIGFEWYAPFRKERIAEVLGGSSGLTVADMVKLQTDYLSGPARRILTCLKGLEAGEPEVRRSLGMLREWDCVLSVDSAPAALFETWHRSYLRPALLEGAVSTLVSPEKLEAALAALTLPEDQVGDSRTDLELISRPETWLTGDPTETLDGILLSSLREAFLYLEMLLGPDQWGWRWGRLHHALFTHPLSAMAGREKRERWDVGPAPRGGSGDTVGNTAYRQEDFRQTGGSSFRIVVDVGEWDRSVAMNSPGQSGDPRSSHYADLFQEWANDRVFPLLYSREAVEAATGQRILLKPREKN